MTWFRCWVVPAVSSAECDNVTWYRRYWISHWKIELQVRAGRNSSRYLQQDFSSVPTMGDWRGGETELSSLLWRLLRSRTNLFTDVEIVCSQNKVISSHRLVLSVTSQYFQDILYPARDGRESLQAVHTVNMTDVDHSIMMVYISYVYSGHLEMPPSQDIWQLLRCECPLLSK